MSAGLFAYRVRSSLHMNAISLLLGLLLGIVMGAAIGFLYARGRLAAAAADASARARAAEQRAALVDGQLAERFQALSAQALDASTARFLEIAEGRLQAANANAAGELETRRAAVEHLVAPLQGDPGPGGGPAARVRRGPDARRTPRWPSRSKIARQSSDQLRRRPRRWSPRCGGRRPAAAGARCSCAGWSSWPG